MTKIEHSKEHGFCIICDIKRGTFARAGSVTNKIGHVDAATGSTGRSNVHVNGHVSESKKNQEKSYFYNFTLTKMLHMPINN